MRCSLWLYSPNVTGKELLAICRGGACACLCAPLLCSSPTRRDLPAGPATPAWLLADAGARLSQAPSCCLRWLGSGSFYTTDSTRTWAGGPLSKGTPSPLTPSFSATKYPLCTPFGLQPSYFVLYRLRALTHTRSAILAGTSFAGDRRVKHV